MTPTISVVIPVLNDEDALMGCLARLDAQTLAPLEVIVVDNAPQPTLRLPAQTRPFPIFVLHEPAPGVSAASATGYDAAAGQIIARCDADSRPGADWLERVAAHFEADPALDAITGPAHFHDLPGPAGRVASTAYQLGLRVGMGLAMANTPLWGTNMAMRNSTWEGARTSVHRHDPRVHDDLGLSFQLGPHATIRHCPELPMTAEARIVSSRAALTSRVSRALMTCRVNWSTLSPGRRWVHRLSNGRRLPQEGLPWN
ncbi:glycosyltransferase family A protein [Actinomycetota bacterium]